MKTFWNTFSAEHCFEKRMVFKGNNPEGIPIEEKKEKPPLLQETQPLLHDLAERVEAMRNMSEGEFLKKERSERLPLITEPPTKLEEVSAGKTLTINFHGNKELERRITAGQTLPATIQKITAHHDGESKTGTRRGLLGEFFTEKGERLLILEGTTVTIETAQTEEQVQQREAEIQKKSEFFTKSYLSEKTEKEPSQTQYEKIAKACYEQDIDPKYVFALLDDKEQKTDNEIESILTEIQRDINDYQTTTGKHAEENGKFTLDFFIYQYHGKPELNKICTAYNIPSDELQKALQEREKEMDQNLMNKDRVIQYPDGTKRRGGSRSWRNCNPGNIEYGRFAKEHGAIGSDGRFAVFPNEEIGEQAKIALLKTSTYIDKTIKSAILKYAPTFENNSTQYANTIANAAGVSAETILKNLDDNQFQRMVHAMTKIEGWKPGVIEKNELLS